MPICDPPSVGDCDTNHEFASTAYSQGFPVRRDPDSGYVAIFDKYNNRSVLIPPGRLKKKARALVVRILIGFGMTGLVLQAFFPQVLAAIVGAITGNLG